MDCSLPGASVLRIAIPSKKTGVDCHFLLQEIFPTQGLNPGLPHCRQTLYSPSHQGSPEKDQRPIRGLLSAVRTGRSWRGEGFRWSNWATGKWIIKPKIFNPSRDDPSFLSPYHVPFFLPFLFSFLSFSKFCCVISPSLGRAQKWTRQNRSPALPELIFRETRLFKQYNVYLEEWVCKTNVVDKREVWIGGEAILRVVREPDLWEEISHWRQGNSQVQRLNSKKNVAG